MSDLPERWLDSKEQELWRAYLYANNRLMKLINDDLETNAGFDGLTYEILVRLSDSATRALRMTELADVISASKSRLTYRIEQLEKIGWVERRSCDEDGRGAWCTLTDKGFSILEKTAPTHVQTVLDAFIKAIPVSKKDELINIFNSIAKEEEE